MNEIISFPGKGDQPATPSRRGRPRGPARKVDAQDVLDAATQAEDAMAGIRAILANSQDCYLDKIDRNGIVALQRVVRENVEYLKTQCARVLPKP